MGEHVVEVALGVGLAVLGWLANTLVSSVRQSGTNASGLKAHEGICEQRYTAIAARAQQVEKISDGRHTENLQRFDRIENKTDRMDGKLDRLLGRSIPS